jgi:hypothetical protein
MQAHREACTASDDMAVQNTWAAIEDYLARLIAAGVDVEKKRPRNEKGPPAQTEGRDNPTLRLCRISDYS